MNPQPQNSNTQPTSTTTTRAIASEGGFQFEIKMAAVIGLLGLKRGDEFEIHSNKDDAGNFDDIVYTAGDQRYFIQLKHSGSPDKHKLDEKFLKDLLPKCFKSYRDIKNGKNFKDIPIENSQFLVYTNRELDDVFSQHERKKTAVDIFFKTRDHEIFNLIPDEKRTILYTPLENAVKNSTAGRVPNDPELKSLISEFLNKLIIVTGQESHWNLDELIVKEIWNDEIEVEYDEYKSIVHHFKTSLENWWRKKKIETMTPKTLTKWLQKAKTKYYNPFVKSCKKKLLGSEIHFSYSEISLLQPKLSNNPAVHFRSDSLTLCSTLLLDCLPQSKYIFVTFELLQSNKNMLLDAWLGGHWEWLIVFCDSTVQPNNISKTCLDIRRYITTDPPNKHLIILTACSMQKIDDFFTIDHNFKFEQLSKESQKLVLDKKIDFQGCEVTMRSVLPRHGNVQHVLGPELVTDLITEGTAVNIGGRLQENTGCHAPRGLKKYIYLHLEVLQNPDIYGEVFAVSGMTKNELSEIVPSFESLENPSEVEEEEQIYDENTDSRFIVLPTEHGISDFSYLCKKYQGKKLHWLKYIPKYGKLLWKQSHGAPDSLLHYVDLERTRGEKKMITKFMKRGSCEVKEESIWDSSERIVLVVAEPGMGKSSTTTKVARHIKLADSTSWVVRINWNDHTRKLQEINVETFSFDSLVEFLCSAAFPESKYADINRSLLRQALQDSGNVTVLMDGFDEICPTYAEKAFIVLREIMKTEVRNVWVTSRPVQRQRIEKELSVAAFNLKKISREWQERMFCDIWRKKANGNNGALVEYIQDLLEHANETVYHRDLTGCPLHIIMIASAFEENLERYLETGEKSLPGKPELLHLFVERKLHIYETEKKKEDLTKASVQDDHEILKNIYLENLEKCSLFVTLPYELNPLRDEETQSAIQSFVERIQAGKDKIGIVMNVVEDRPHFVHQALAEYFTECWFSKNFM